MSDKFTYEDLLEKHREAQKKLDYFVLGVTLAFLAFSIERFNLSQTSKYLWLIYLSWPSLLISFLIGLKRQEYLICFYGMEVQRLRYHSELELMDQAKGKKICMVKEGLKTPWTDEEIEMRHINIEDLIKKIKKDESKFNKGASWAYDIQKFLFVIGLISNALFKLLNL